MALTEEHQGVAKEDIASGKLARNFNGAFDILSEGPNAGGRSHKLPCRQIVVPTGVVEYVGLDGIAVTLPNMGGAYTWDIQAIRIVSGAGTVIW